MLAWAHSERGQMIVDARIQDLTAEAARVVVAEALQGGLGGRNRRAGTVAGIAAAAAADPELRKQLLAALQGT